MPLFNPFLLLFICETANLNKRVFALASLRPDNHRRQNAISAYTRQTELLAIQLNVECAHRLKILVRNWRNQAVAQACAVCSPTSAAWRTRHAHKTSTWRVAQAFDSHCRHQCGGCPVPRARCEGRVSRTLAPAKLRHSISKRNRLIHIDCRASQAVQGRIESISHLLLEGFPELARPR